MGTSPPAAAPSPAQVGAAGWGRIWTPSLRAQPQSFILTSDAEPRRRHAPATGAPPATAPRRASNRAAGRNPVQRGRP